MGRVSNLTSIRLDDSEKRLSFIGKGIFAPPSINGDIDPVEFSIRQSTTSLTFTTGPVSATIVVSGELYGSWYDTHPIMIYSRSRPDVFGSGFITSYAHPNLVLELQYTAGDGTPLTDWCIGSTLTVGALYVNTVMNTLDVIVAAGSDEEAMFRTSNNVAATVARFGNNADGSYLPRMGGTMAGDLKFANGVVSQFDGGSIAAPSITFTSDQTSGITSLSPQIINFVSGGTEIAIIHPTGMTVNGEFGAIDINATTVEASTLTANVLVLNDVSMVRTGPSAVHITPTNPADTDPVILTLSGSIIVDDVIGFGSTSSIRETLGEVLISTSNMQKIIVRDDETEFVTDVRVRESIQFDDASITQTGSSQLLVAVNGIPKFEIGSTRSHFYTNISTASSLIMGNHRISQNITGLNFSASSQPVMSMTATSARFNKNVVLDHALLFDNASISQTGSNDLSIGINGFPKLTIHATHSNVKGDLLVDGDVTRTVRVDEFVGDGTLGPYPLTFVPAHRNNILVDVDGMLQRPSTYTVTASSVTFTTLKTAAQQICVRSF